MSKGLKNPAAVATIASTESGQKAIMEIGSFVKVAIIGTGVLVIGRYAYSKYKQQRADNYARKNIGNPNLIAATVIYRSIKRLEFPEFLSWLLPSIDLYTDESSLMDVASKVTNAQSVADAYSILFDRNLNQDIANGLSTDQMQTFWNIINSPASNNDNTFYPIGSKLYVLQKEGITVNIAEEVNGRWIGTNRLFGNLEFNDLVGTVIANGKVTQDMVNSDTQDLIGQNYYIVEEKRTSGQCLFTCNTGVVVHNQVTNSKIV